MGLAMMVVVYRFAKKRGLPVEPRAKLPEFMRSLWDGALALAMPAIVLGSIIVGIATPTEAAVVAVVYALILGLFVYREIRFGQLPEIFANVAVTSAAVMVTVGAAQLFGWITAAEGLGNDIGRWLTALSTNPYVILLVINIVLLILGMFMEPVPIMLLTVPILFPVVTKLGIDPVHFGVVVTLNLMIGCLTPPVGLNLFLASAISGVPVMQVARAATPFIIVLLIVLALITYIPQLVLWLPQLIQAGR
jgi:C4-dicarboxylate transporter DctM subunit